MNINVELKNISELPCMIYSNHDIDREHTIILIHGFNNDKYEGSKVALKLAGLGYQVISFDIDGHGDRSRSLFDKINSDADFGKLLFHLIEKTSEEVVSLCERIESAKTSVIGISLGANVVNHLIKENIGFDKCISVLGALSFVDQVIYSMEKNSINDFNTKEEKELINYVMDLDPLQYMNNHIIDCQWLLINGVKDDDVPAQFTRNIYEDLLKGNEKIEYYEEDEYHYFSNDMIEKVISFIQN